MRQLIRKGTAHQLQKLDFSSPQASRMSLRVRPFRRDFRVTVPSHRHSDFRVAAGHVAKQQAHVVSQAWTSDTILRARARLGVSTVSTRNSEPPESFRVGPQLEFKLRGKPPGKSRTQRRRAQWLAPFSRSPMRCTVRFCFGRPLSGPSAPPEPRRPGPSRSRHISMVPIFKSG